MDCSFFFLTHDEYTLLEAKTEKQDREMIWLTFLPLMRWTMKNSTSTIMDSQHQEFLFWKVHVGIFNNHFFFLGLFKIVYNTLFVYSNTTTWWDFSPINLYWHNELHLVSGFCCLRLNNPSRDFKLPCATLCTVVNVFKQQNSILSTIFIGFFFS